MKFVRFLLHLFMIALLTLLTQVGGVIWILNLLLQQLFRKTSFIKTFLSFFILYFAFTFMILPNVAPLMGRQIIKNGKHLCYSHVLYVLLNRNYVTPSLNELLNRTALQLEGSNLQIQYLDANFPFWNGFPLLPHTSHDDGKKVDLSFIYESPTGQAVNITKSITGYGVFAPPKKGEYDQIKKCKEKGYRYYDYSKYFGFGEKNTAYQFSVAANKKIISALLQEPALDKIFIEPHLLHRMQLQHPKLRYHGCHAVRHDDHIHVQVR